MSLVLICLAGGINQGQKRPPNIPLLDNRIITGVLLEDRHCRITELYVELEPSGHVVGFSFDRVKEADGITGVGSDLPRS